MSTYTPARCADPNQLNLFNPTVRRQPTLINGAPLVQVRLVSDIDHVYTPTIQVCSPADVAAFIRPYFRDKAVEEFLTINLNTANLIINVVLISIGGLSASIVEPARVLQAAWLANAKSVIAVHNHPSQNPEPSRQDIAITRQLVEAGKLHGITINDHLIIAGKTYTSFAERGLMG